MGERTGIGWTEATWNPVTGCSRVSDGCRFCYAEALSLRRGWSKKPWTARNAAENVVLHPERLDQPLRLQKPRMVFVNSMSDLFHERIPESFVDAVFAVMALTPQHTYQILTKRADRMRRYVSTPGRAGAVAAETGSGCDEDPWQQDFERDWPFVRPDDLADRWPLANVWLGVSVEDQRRADERIPELLDTPAAVRFVSAEPLLGPIQFTKVGTGPWFNALDGWYLDESGSAVCGPWPMLDWVIVGGESGPGHRPMDLDAFTHIVDQCRAADVPTFVKQDSGPRPGKQGRIPDEYWVQEFPREAVVP